MSEIMKATVPVFMFLVANDTVYLQRRFQTGYMDGYYEPPAGKVDAGEFPIDAACREALEEAAVHVDPDDIELFHTYMNLTHNNPWLGLMFRTSKWRGAPRIQEPAKCDHAAFFHIDKLPKVTPQVKDAITRMLTAPAIQMNNYSDIEEEK